MKEFEKYWEIIKGKNDFCSKECTGGDIKEIKECSDHYCPFYPFREDSLEWQNIKRRSNGKEK